MRIRRTKDQWQALFSEQKKSGKTIACFCQEKEIQTKKFYRKKKELNDTSSFVKIPVNSLRAQAIKIKIGDVTIETEPGFNEKELQTVIRIVLEALNA